MPIETREQFLKAVMAAAKLESMKQADAAARAVIALTKAIIGEELSQKIAEVSPSDLREGWESIKAFPTDIFERDELLFEMGELPEEEPK
jgi:uncharacterized protein (DUF2267 family)